MTTHPGRMLFVNLPVADGYGALVSKMASSLPIKLSIPATKVSVTRVDPSGSGSSS